MEIDQVYKAPSIPKLSRRNIKSTLISGAIKPGIELKKTKFSFIKPLVKLIPDSLVPIKEEENKGSLVKNIQSGIGIQKLLEQSNKILSQIKQQLSLDFLSRINEEKKELAENKKRIAAEKVKDKEKKIESGGKGLLGGTLSAVVAPAKSIFQKLLDFFSIVLTGILVNSAFKWLQKPENQKKLQDFFNFLKEYWQELLIVFGAVKLLGLVRKIWKVANAIKGLIDFFKSKPKLPCNCPKSPAQQGGLPDCEPVKDCVDSLIRDPKKGPGFLQSLAQALLTTAAFAPFLLLLKKQPQTAQPQQQKQTPILPISPKTPPPSSPPPPPPSSPQKPVQASSSVPTNSRVPFKRAPTATPPAATPGGAFRSGVPMGTRSGLFSIFAQFGLGQLEQKRVADRVSKLQQLKTSNPQEYKKQINQIRIDAKNEKYLNLVNEITGSPSIPNAYILKALGELRADEIPESIFNIGDNPNKLTPDLKTPVIIQSTNQPLNKKGLPRKVETIVREKNPNISQQQTLHITAKAIQYIQSGYEITRAVTEASSLILKEALKKPNGEISGLAGGGTVGGPGRMGIDSVPAMIASGAKTMMGGAANALLAPGEEVIRASEAMRWRPLLKDINDKGGQLWQAFTNAVRKQGVNESIITDLIGQFGKIIEEFKDLLDKEATNIQRKGRTGGATGGGLRPSFGGGNPIGKIDKGVGGLIQDVGGMIGRNKGTQTGIPGGGWIGEQTGRREANDRYQDFTNSIRSLLDKSRLNTSAPNINVQKSDNLTQNVINPQIEKTILGDKNVYVIPVPISTESSKLFSSKSSGGNISVINLPRKVVNLSKPSKPKSAPSSSSGTSLPSISPIDESNDYIFTTPSMYGILVV